ncbi:MAG: hypothetical protein AAGJ35_04455, partial [Myxococcota bacterium]
MNKFTRINTSPSSQHFVTSQGIECKTTPTSCEAADASKGQTNLFEMKSDVVEPEFVSSRPKIELEEAICTQQTANTLQSMSSVLADHSVSYPRAYRFFQA